MESEKSMSSMQPYRVEAYNTAKQSENKIHDDAVARQYGFSGGLVPGVEVLAYSGALRISNHVRPRSLVEAQYSIRYCIGLVATRGAQALLPMTAADVGVEQAETLATRVTLGVDPDCEARFPAETPVIVRIRAGGEVFHMHVPDKIGAREIQYLRAVFLPPVILFHLQVGALDLRAHRPVQQEHFGFDEF